MSDCNTDECASHQAVEKAMERFEIISNRLSDSHHELRENLIRLTVVVEDIARINMRMDKLEGRQDEIRQWMYKISGVIAVGAFTIPLVLSYFGK